MKLPRTIRNGVEERFVQHAEQLSELYRREAPAWRTGDPASTPFQVALARQNMVGGELLRLAALATAIDPDMGFKMLQICETTFNNNKEAA